MRSSEMKPVGYRWLAEKFEESVMPHWKESCVLERGSRRREERDGRVFEYLPIAQDPGSDVFSQLEFALRREGLHLELLRKVLPRIDPDDLAGYVRQRPTGRYARCLWWLYESFTASTLALPDVRTGNYVDLLRPGLYVTGSTRKVKRQRVNVNLLGTIDFSPMVRWEGLGEWNESALRDRCEEIIGEYPSRIFKRAVRYLYAKESKSSHDIERETPDQKRAKVFIRLLEQAWQRSFMDKESLVELQRALVDLRYANEGWRSEQVYVGATLAPGVERVHFVGPKPEDLDDLMDGFLAMARQFTRHGRVWRDTLVAAAVVSFTFDFLHPFSDGNGRIHRFLLHHVLARNKFGPDGFILPVSAVILNRPRDYDEALESFSTPLMELVDYKMDERQRMTVTNDTADHYRYIDCTKLTRITIDLIRETIESELPAELGYLIRYDETRAMMRDVVDLPDRVADLFVKLCWQNGGSLSKRKRNLSEFSPLTDEEIASLEAIVREGLGMDS